MPGPDIVIRNATESDLGSIARVASATGQDEEWGGTDPAYVRHLLAHGRVVVAGLDGTVTGYGATRVIGAGPAAITMLCDLFVDPAAHGLGCGQAMLAALWRGEPRRMTFSSLHAHALPLYTRAGLSAWWPLLYLAGDVRAVGVPDGWSAAQATVAEVGETERQWTGADRIADHHAWAARPGGQPVVAHRDGEVLAVGAVGGAAREYGITHLAIAPSASDGDAGQAVQAVLAALDPPGGQARVCLPAPHPATRPLLAAGWHSEAMDLFMATEPGLLNPLRAVPSSPLA